MQILHAIPLVEVTDDHPAVIQPVTVYPTRISLSSWRGCNLKCQYCVLQQDPLESDPFHAQRVSTVAELLAAYDSAVRGNADVSRLKITLNDHTDPFLKPEISADTLALVEALALDVSMGCKDSCSRGAIAKPVLGEVIILDDYRYNIRLRVAGVMVDITTKERAVIATGTRAL
jgi:hypothetical protein